MKTLCLFNCHAIINTMTCYCAGFIFQSVCKIKRETVCLKNMRNMCANVIMYRIYNNTAKRG